jgi:hypothetical protein
MNSIVTLLSLVLMLTSIPAPASADLSWGGLQKSVSRNLDTFGKSKAQLEEMVGYKVGELEAYQHTLEQVEAEIRRWESETCPTTGEKSIVTLTEDPRPEMYAHIQELEEDIAFLQEKIAE